MSKPILLVASLVICNFLSANDLPEGIHIESYKNWDGCYVIDAPKADLKLILIPASGGRINHYGPPSKNLFYEPPEADGKTTANTKGWFWGAAYNLDIGPETRPLTGHPALWLGPYAAVASKPYAVTLTSNPDGVSGIQLSKEISVDSASELRLVKLTQRMKNISDKENAYCLWDRTVCRGGGFLFFPINKKSRFPAGWSLRHRDPTGKGKDTFDGVTPSAPNVKVIDRLVVAQAIGPQEGKLGADSDAGWMAYVRDDVLFIKVFRYFADGEYSDCGNSVEFYWSDKVGEVEPLGPEIKLKPGDECTFPEVWAQITLKQSVTTFEQAAALAKEIESKLPVLKENLPK